MKVFEYCQTLTSLFQEFDLVSSTVKTTVKNHDTKDHVEISASLKQLN
jgi:hypothetical protein